jgi:predicted lipid-binding transport protein (Tim44 family)
MKNSPPPQDGTAYNPAPSPYPAHDLSAPSSQFPQQGAYNQAPYPADPNGPPPPGGAAEGERGLGGALLGGLAGGVAGHRKNHGVLGALGGALLGSYAQDHLGKKHRHSSHQSHHHGKH